MFDTRSFRVVASMPVYGPFDNFTGYRTETVAYCGTLEAAYNYCESEYLSMADGYYDDAYGSVTEVRWDICMPNGKTLSLWDLNTATMCHYTGPVVPDNIPF